ncbi:MAG: hypothetical protein ACRCU2_03720 [Planktothrix sp.]
MIVKDGAITPNDLIMVGSDIQVDAVIHDDSIIQAFIRTQKNSSIPIIPYQADFQLPNPTISQETAGLLTANTPETISNPLKSSADAEQLEFTSEY